MSFDPFDRHEHAELLEAAKENFRTKHITENMFRRKLRMLGYNATDIEQEVENILKERDKGDGVG